MSSIQVENIGIQKISNGEIRETEDKVAVEEPLEIILSYSTSTGHMQKNIAVTMRTPGNDEELAAGFLFTEGIIQQYAAIEDIKQASGDDQKIRVTLKEGILPVLTNAARNFYSTSSCGVCGKASIDAIRTTSQYTGKKDDMFVDASLLYSLQNAVKKQQQVFEETGGIHASALFTKNAEFILLREDVGRHNALDKLVGALLMKGELPPDKHILFLSGRASFELIQKAAMAGIKFIAAVGAPSSLAVDLARELNITLTGFIKSNRFNIYSGKQRLKLS